MRLPGEAMGSVGQKMKQERNVLGMEVFMKQRRNKWTTWILVFAMLVSMIGGAGTDAGVAQAAKAKNGKLSASSKKMTVGQKAKLKVKKLPKGAKKVTYKWKSNKKSVIKISGKATKRKVTIQAKKAGNAKVTCTMKFKVKKSGRLVKKKAKLTCKVKVQAKRGSGDGGAGSKPGGKPSSPTAKPGTTGKPGETAAPGTTSKPGETAAPGTTNNPNATVAPGTTGKPGETAAPGTTNNPNATVEPGTTGKPGETAAPGTTNNPNATAEPGTTGKPGETAKPGTTNDPNATAEPGTTSKPNVTEKPAAPTPVPGSAEAFAAQNQETVVKAMGAGWNLGNQLEANISGTPSETAWGNPVITEDLILAVKNAGFKTIRIPVSYLNKIGSAPNYTIDAAWLNRVQEVVDMCIDNGLYAIINIHGDGYNSVQGGWLLCNGSDQETIRTKYKKCWEQIADKFKGYDEHLIFESMNEEFDGTYNTPNKDYYQNINEYNQIFVDTVRQSGGNNGMRWLLIPGWNTDIGYTTGDYGFSLPTDTHLSADIPSGQKRIMISVHYYNPWGFCGEENSQDYTQWGSVATDSSKVPGYGTENDMKNLFNKLYTKFVKNGYPVIIGEYGAQDRSDFDSKNNECRAYFAKKVCEVSLQYGCVPVWWDNGANNGNGKGAFGLFNRNGSVTVTEQGIIDAIMSIYSQESTATGITLDKTSFTTHVGDADVTLKATLEPADSKDTIRWTSSDEGIASVNANGKVTAVKVGTAVITAEANGHKATCTVTVEALTTIRASLRSQSADGWVTLQGDYVDISSAGGRYTLKLTDTANKLKKMTSLYIKDISLAEDGDTSIFKDFTLTINSITFNGTALSMNKTVFTPDTPGKFDFCFINSWGDNYVNDITGTKEGDNTIYSFSKGTYQSTNTVQIDFTISNIKVN